MKTCQLTWFRRAVLELARSEGGGQRRDGCFFLGCESLVLSLHRQVVAGGRGHCRLASWPCISGPTCGGCIGAQCSVTPLIGRRGQHGHHQDSKVSLASVRKEHKSSGWWRRTTPCVHGFHIGMGRDPDPHDEPSAQNRGCQLHSIPNIQRTRRATKNLVQFLQDMYIYTRVVQFQYRSQLHCPLKLPPKTPPLLPGLNPPTGVVEIPPIPALLPANKMESSDFPALSPRKIKAVPVVWAPKTLPRTEDVVSVRDSRNSTQQRRND